MTADEAAVFMGALPPYSDGDDLPLLYPGAVIIKYGDELLVVKPERVEKLLQAITDIGDLKLSVVESDIQQTLKRVLFTLPPHRR